MIVYQTNSDGLYVGEVLADESPLEPGVFLIPGGCVSVAPPAANDGSIVRYANGQWVQEAIPQPPEPAPPTPEQLVAANISAIQGALDSAAKAQGYDNILSACSYAAQAVGAPFQAEGAAFLAWRSATWAQAFVVLAQVEVGTAALPTPTEAVAQMPALVLP